LEGKRFSPALSRTRHDIHRPIVEPELDMDRQSRRNPALLTRISQFIRWLMPQSAHVGPPMRSIARELEERFPSRDN